MTDRVWLAALALAGGLLGGALIAPPATHAQEAAVGRTSGLPVPRFLSLKADKTNVRSGPTKDHAVAWVFTRAGLPVEVTAEFETWRRIRDADGAEGWVYHSMLSGRRTALVGPWLKDGPTPLYANPDADSAVRARLEPGVLGKLDKCDGKWCHFFDNGFDGFIEQEKLWGVYPGEKLE
ncbi:SH3 domain-containing protein [Ancylobacter gelatini]|uniref:SH3 domain-containing protein n=1 Tax=Ancylobacter gelatini TaxID=2919920 RepID=UPI003CC9DFEA